MPVWRKFVNGEYLKRLVTSEAETIMGAAALIALFGLASRLLGLVRDRILAGSFGAAGLDVYYAAFEVPDLLYSFLVVGAISTAFIPVFADYYRRDQAEAWRVAGGLFALFSVVFVGLAVGAIIFAPQLVRFVVPGFDPVRQAAATELARIMFLSPVLFGLANVLASVLQYFRRFFVVSAAPILYNLGIIVGALVFVPRMGTVGLAWGVVLGALMYFVLHLTGYLGLGGRLMAFQALWHAGVRRIILQTIPRALGVSINQLAGLVVIMIASGLAAGSIGAYNLALNLQAVPVGLFGVAIASAAFPKLSRASADHDEHTFRQVLSASMRQTLFLVLPAAVLLIVLRAHIVRVVYGLGAFGWGDTRLTAAALGIFALSIVAQALVPILARAFYSQHRTAVPVGASIGAVAAIMAAAAMFVPAFQTDRVLHGSLGPLLKVADLADIRILGLVLAFSVAAFLNAGTLVLFLGRRARAGFENIGRLSVAAAVLAAAAYGALYLLAGFIDTRTTFGVFLQGFGAGIIGLVMYVACARFLGVAEGAVMTAAIGAVAKRFAFWRKRIPPAIREDDKLA
ncbi:murein biosynthesis integral membrane protein MurJ [Candidatus Parcubacteria bacterium]|nr:murein biosynthesis integral membrane protein MurJ [Candidatus Parcubacteria bacterium]